MPVSEHHDPNSFDLRIVLTAASLDISLGQWLALTPHQIVKDTLNISEEDINKFPTEKPVVVAAVGS